MPRQVKNGTVLIEDRHDQYAMSIKHRISRFSSEETATHDPDLLQACLQGVLQEVDTEFKSLNISYVLWAGTLLGAYRHHDFIPWDNDVDIAMSTKDLFKVRQVLVNKPNC
jgi:hypothetical protein